MRRRLSSFLRPLSIRKKLQAVIMASVAAALVLACGALLAFTIIAMRASIRTSVGILAQVIGENSTAALSFGDNNAARELLQGLRTQRSITHACIYLPRGLVFAAYSRGGAPGCPAAPAALGGDWSGFRDDKVFVFHTIRLEGEPVGLIYLESDLVDMRQQVVRSVWVSLLILAGSGIVAYLLGATFRS